MVVPLLRLLAVGEVQALFVVVSRYLPAEHRLRRQVVTLHRSLRLRPEEGR